nr:Uncharacterised protein [Providencia rettgeri]
MKWKLRFGAVAGHTLEFYDVAILQRFHHI